MTFYLFMVWSIFCPSCCGDTGRLLHGICKYTGERLVAHGPLVCVTVLFVLQLYDFTVADLGFYEINNALMLLLLSIKLNL